MATASATLARPVAVAAGRRRPFRVNGWIVATYVALAVFVLWTVVPFIWMVLASIKTNKEIYQDFTIFPQTIYLGHYSALLSPSGKFAIWMKNSAVISTVATVLSITLGAMGAYAVTRLRF